MTPSTKPTVLVDGHVHLHGCFEPSDFFAAAHANFCCQATLLGAREWWGMLLFTESASADWFRRLADGDSDLRSRGWTLRRLAESCSVVLEGPGGEQIILVAGSQIVTAERLEVLAIGTRERIPDGTPIHECLQTAQRAGAIRVVPWGNGKWLGSRGRVIKALIANADAGDFFLGDNSGRLCWGPSPREFALGRRKGLYLLPGSDPLPFRRETSKVGSYGFSLASRLDQAQPFAWLRAQLAAEPEAIQPYGQQERLYRFVKNQVAMQIHKRVE